LFPGEFTFAGRFRARVLFGRVLFFFVVKDVAAVAERLSGELLTWELV
jgi:hypothetical protein